MKTSISLLLFFFCTAYFTAQSDSNRKINSAKIHLGDSLFRLGMYEDANLYYGSIPMESLSRSNYLKWKVTDSMITCCVSDSTKFENRLRWAEKQIALNQSNIAVYLLEDALRFRPDNAHVKQKIRQLICGMRTDSVFVSNNIFTELIPRQLFLKENYKLRKPHQKMSTVYCYKDSSLFNGIYVYTENYYGPENDVPPSSYTKTIAHFKNGKIDHLFQHTYCEEEIRLFEPEDTLFDSEGKAIDFRYKEVLKRGKAWLCQTDFYDQHFVSVHYAKSGLIQDKTISYTLNGSEYITDYLFYENGDTNRYGTFINGNQEGVWHAFYMFEDTTIEQIEFWKEGMLLDLKTENMIYVGKKAKIIDKKQFFEIIKAQNYLDYGTFNLNKNQMLRSHGKATIMYSEILCPEFGSNEKTIRKIIRKAARKYRL